MLSIECESIRIPVLATGKGWLVVDKPVGMTVHNLPGHDLCSAVSDFIQKEGTVREKIDMDPDFGANPVHRLDKETSGVILLAVNRAVFRFFSSQFESRQVQKQYVAILHGRVENKPETDSRGTWAWPLSKGAGGRRKPQGTGRRQPCETRYRVLAHSTHYTMVEIDLLTGRKHQIRRHAKLAGHPVVGDTRYGSNRALTFLRHKLGFDRLGLHARALTFPLPGDKETKTVETPAIPVQMQKLFNDDPGLIGGN
jgi:RluA family pseudouridine synthase